MNDILVSFAVECPAACESIYILLKQKNIECFKSDTVNRRACWYVYINEKDVSVAIDTVPILANCERNIVAINTKYLVCHTTVGFDDVKESIFKLNTSYSEEAFDSYDAAKEDFFKTASEKDENISIVKILFDEYNHVFLNESYIVTSYFNLHTSDF